MGRQGGQLPCNQQAPKPTPPTNLDVHCGNSRRVGHEEIHCAAAAALVVIEGAANLTSESGRPGPERRTTLKGLQIIHAILG